MQEIWKAIKGYDGLYEVSNTGLVRSYVVSSKRKGTHLLKPTANESGYLSVTLYKPNGERHGFLVHRLVASAFIPNPNNYPCINHKDENVDNNCSDNLEWCTYAYNNSYGTARIRQIGSTSRRVNQYTLEGIWIARYLSVSIASRLLNISECSIRNCCSNIIECAEGYRWEYED